MGRSKIKVKLIQDHKKRKSTLVNRKAGLVKKISELSILCDIKACMIIYEGNYNHQIWPKDPNKVKEVINLYKNQLPFEGRSKRVKTLSNYFENDQKKRAEIKVEKYPTCDSRFDYLSEKELQNLTGVVEKRMDKAKGKIELLKSMNAHIGSSSLSHQQIWDYNLKNQTTTLWPISNVNSFSHYNNFFQLNIPISGVNSMIESENWLANDEIGSSLTMQTMGNNGVGLSSTMQLMGNNGIGSSLTMQPMDQYLFMYNDSTHGIGSSSTMQPMGNNGIGSTSTIHPMDQYPFIYNDSTLDIGSSSTLQPMDQYPFIYNDSTHGFV